ncbi:hypothetical protein BS47DRAFT_1397815 [Hydnum rufescens UP504]|uniref:Uncharacterized protein n=1 Tax=Hydnum rufescens UP504 TaxID=1448309 RepID=A0A9P6DSA9_9AGAM|nr:hypothetical protein BS47DRAFT_1397815 [Hydnum rufescens UP504]
MPSSLPDPATSLSANSRSSPMSALAGNPMSLAAAGPAMQVDAPKLIIPTPSLIKPSATSNIHIPNSLPSVFVPPPTTLITNQGAHAPEPCTMAEVNFLTKLAEASISDSELEDGDSESEFLKSEFEDDADEMFDDVNDGGSDVAHKSWSQPTCSQRSKQGQKAKCANSKKGRTTVNVHDLQAEVMNLQAQDVLEMQI